jgi:broad specificity phosphatase PhoE
LFLVRHGESTANEVNRFAGAIDAPLTLLGRAQARRAGSSWQTSRIDRVYVSPLIRAQQTAQILVDTLPAGVLPESPATYDARLSERHFGDFTLQNKTRLQRRFGLRDYEASLYRSDDALHGGESFEHFRERILTFLKMELYPHLLAGRRVLVVAHKYVIELMSRLILRLPDAEGYDLRLPNARVMAGSDLGRYVEAESPTRNLLADWIVMRHSAVLAIAAGLGLALNLAGTRLAAPSWALLVLLMIAATISLGRVSLDGLSTNKDREMLPMNRLSMRFIALPWILTLLGVLLIPVMPGISSDALLAIALLLAAPTAVTALILARSSGGMIRPSVMAVLVTTAMSAANTIALLAFFELSDLAFQAFVFVGLSLSSLVLPMMIVRVMRRQYPISTAKMAEDHAAVAVLALAAFVVLSLQNIELGSFYPNGLIAIGLGLGLRLFALRLARHGSLFGLDDYFSLSYPNVFLVIVLAGLTGNAIALELATWFLVPMFMLAPLDDLLIRRLQRSQPHFHLLSYLGINQAPVTRPPAMATASRFERPQDGLQGEGQDSGRKGRAYCG